MNDILVGREQDIQIKEEDARINNIFDSVNVRIEKPIQSILSDKCVDYLELFMKAVLVVGYEVTQPVLLALQAIETDFIQEFLATRKSDG